MKALIKSGLMILFITASLLSCSRTDLVSRSADPNYLPLLYGRFTEYSIERTRFSLSSPPEVKIYNVKTGIVDSLRDLKNQVVYKTDYLYQYQKDGWKLDSTATVWRTPDKILCRENGRIIIKMIYPLANELVWDGNSFNDLGKTAFRVVNLGKPYQVGSMDFPNTVTVVRQDDSTLLSRSRYVEVYALDVGLILKEKIFLNYCGTLDCRGKGLIDFGWTERTTIKNEKK